MVRVERQCGTNDCGIAALAMLRSNGEDDYAVVWAAAAIAARDPHLGLLTRELVATGKRLGLQLTVVRSYDLDVDVGVLRVRSHAHHRDGHWVTVRYGLIWDPLDGSARPWRQYAADYRARFGWLARLARRDVGAEGPRPARAAAPVP